MLHKVSTKIYCPTRLNYFVGSHRAHLSIDWQFVSTTVSTQNIRWKFTPPPPSAALCGGLWERIVRMVKEILRKVFWRDFLNCEELSTTLCNCEQVINSRPIAYVSEDNRDPAYLTPVMILQELPTSGVLDIDALDSEESPSKE